MSRPRKEKFGGGKEFDVDRIIQKVADKLNNVAPMPPGYEAHQETNDDVDDGFQLTKGRSSSGFGNCGGFSHPNLFSFPNSSDSSFGSGFGTGPCSSRGPPPAVKKPVSKFLCFLLFLENLQVIIICLMTSFRRPSVSHLISNMPSILENGVLPVVTTLDRIGLILEPPDCNVDLELAQ